ncbi:MAG: hypothetical protein Q7T04_03515 [Dehalococcoidia bacterium]|nr:hypothetical protein [Dehalococcoidia bacterium]
MAKANLELKGRREAMLAADPENVSDSLECKHHWMIESPNGVESRGICKACGARKAFSNSWQYSSWARGEIISPRVSELEELYSCSEDESAQVAALTGPI